MQLTRLLYRYEKKWLKLSLIFVAFLTCVLSCSVYYNTSDFDKNFKQIINSVQKNYSTTKDGFLLIKQRFSSFNADLTQDPFLQGKEKLNNLEKKFGSISTTKNKLISEYKKFKLYSEKKPKISSKDKEWELLKNTKQKIKTLSEEIEKKTNEFIEISKAFQEYVNSSIISKVTVLNVKAKKSLGLIAKQMVTFDAENSKTQATYTSIFTQLQKKYSNSFPDKVNEIEKILIAIDSNSNVIESQEIILSASIKKFNELTKNNEQIYSSDPLYAHVGIVQQEIETAVKYIQGIQNDIKILYTKNFKKAQIHCKIEMIIRLATYNDKNVLISLANQVYYQSEKTFGKEGYYRLNEQEFNHHIANNKLFVGEIENEIVGCVLMKK